MRLRQAVCTCLIVIPALAVLSTARGQSTASVGPRRFGVVGGLNSATFGGKDATDPSPDSKTGGLLGAMVVVPIRPNFAFQPELLYTMKGAVLTDPSGDATFKMNYIQLPLLVRFDVPASGGVKPFVLAGPGIAFRQACNFEVKGSFAFSGTCDDLVGSSGQKFETVDYSAIIGGGLAFDVSGKTFTVGARYDYSLSKIQKDTDIKHRVISVVTTFEFPMMK